MNKPTQSHPRLIVFTRYPIPGEVKTRLLSALAPEQTARLHRELTEHTIRTAREARKMCGLSIELRTCGAPTESFRQWLGDDLRYCVQGHGDLGEKMRRAVDDAFATGVTSVVVIGSDCPDLTAAHIEQSVAALARADVVIGPAADGGYYLIGLARCIPELFSDIAWGSDTVFHHTRRKAEALSLKIEQLSTLSDIDRPEDLSLLPPQLRMKI